MITMTLAASEGSRLMGPAWNQAWLPRVEDPSGVRTASSTTIVPTHSTGAMSRRAR
jgi:hypothetical protein